MDWTDAVGDSTLRCLYRRTCHIDGLEERWLTVLEQGGMPTTSNAFPALV